MAEVDRRPEVPSALASITLVDADDNTYTLGELWSERPVVLIHLRHFGCILCRHYAGALRDFYGDFEATGARLIAIGTGGRQYAREFVAERKIPYLVLVDKTMASHEVIRVKQGQWFGILRPRVLWAALKARIYGARQGKTGPNPFKFGATHVIGPGGVLHYAWVNDDYHDNAPVDTLLALAKRVTAHD
ncbi:peroxiredoxin-like family protein [Enhygromyxa salina]|uniref:AhpC/TSA family protein n=1 Tax=Enhygromyxa salina TaxID=215803 RepID=A0A2S9YJ45_9BACT|nr:peroxiredoxin-like family protein [Enhygromyxa salina]PRQ05080.1 AhpC/TSA family protein [Enhygromyxa salina]